MTDEQLLAHALRLRRQNNDDELAEAKACSKRLSSDVWESVSAFANTSGGVIILGLDEKAGFTAAAGFDIDRVSQQFMEGMGDGGTRSRLAHPPKYRMGRNALEGSQVLTIEVEELEPQLKPCYIEKRGVQGGSYKRVGDADILLSPTEVYELQHALVPSETDRAPVDEATVDDLDPDIVDGIIGYAAAHGWKATKITSDRAQRMRYLNITNPKGAVRMAGMIAAGRYPQEFFPSCVVDVTSHPGLVKSTTNTPRFLDRKICEGPIAEVIDEAVGAVARNLRTYSVVVGTGRRDETEIPLDVLREAIANAVAHREYSADFRGQSVTVDIYPDRVEITSPGGLWGGKTKENLADGNSKRRNETLMKLMSAVPLPDGQGTPAEGQGSGIQLMINGMERRALRPPEFRPRIDSFTVVLMRGGAEMEENQRWIQDVGASDLTAHEQALLLAARREGSVDVASVHSQLGIDSDEVRSIASSLVTQGLIAEAGTDRYRLAPDAPVGEDGNPDARILAALSPSAPMGTQELADETGIRPPTVRAHLRKFIAEGKVIPTAPTQSRNRKYLLAAQQATQPASEMAARLEG